MMAGLRLTPAERLRRHRQEMQLALRESLSLDEARSRLAADRIARADRRLADRRAAPSGPLQPAPTRPAERPLPWWMIY